MIAGSVYFGKLLEVCDFVRLESYAESVCPVLSAATGTKYVLSQRADSQQVERWSEGIFNQPGEQTLKFPRVMYVFRPASGDTSERWRAVVFFTPIPHIKGSYGNKLTEHRIAAPVERELGIRLVESCLADTFKLESSDTTLGSEAGLYLHLKILSIPPLRRRFEDGKYTPPGSELRELLETLPAILPETDPSSSAMELQNKRSRERDFLERCDQRIIAALGKDGLQAILRPTDVSAEEWLSAGKRGLW
jgi:hypothetical protein